MTTWSSSPGNIHTPSVLARIGLWNGIAIGAALAVGAFGPQTLLLPLMHGPARLDAALLGLVGLVVLGGVAGWLAGWLRPAWAGGLIWLATAIAMVRFIGCWNFAGASWLAGLEDARLRGLDLYPFTPAVQVRVWMAGFFILIVLGFLGLLQRTRAEGLALESDDRGWPSGRGWFLLALPLLAVTGAGLTADALLHQPLRSAQRLVDDAIEQAQVYAGDLFTLTVDTGINYSALSGVRDQIGERYLLQLGEVEWGPAQRIVIVAAFENGNWLSCSVFVTSSGTQLSHCYDMRPPYTQGVLRLLRGDSFADCRNCFVSASAELSAWLRQQAPRLGPNPQVEMRQSGRYVVTRIRAERGEVAIDCLFAGMGSPILETCREAGP